MAQELKTERTASSQSSATRISYDEFLTTYDGVQAEWVEGQVIELSPASSWHQDLADFFTALLRVFVEIHNLGIVRSAPFQMKLGPNLSGREPDVLFVASQNLDRLKDSHLAGPADLAVEIISPDSRARDRGEKFYEYEAAGVREYWLIDRPRRQAEFYVRGEDGIFRLAPPGADGVYHSEVLVGLGLRVEWLWQDPLPTLISVLREWRLI